MTEFTYSREWYEQEYHKGLYRLHEATPAEVAAQWSLLSYLAQLREAWALLRRPLVGEVLEVGIHHGKTALWMLDEFPAIYRLWAVDWSQVAVDFCRRLARPRLVVWRGTVERLLFADGLLDAVSCIDVTEHLPPEVYRAMLIELARVAKPGAALILHHGRSPHPAHTNDVSESDLLSDFAEAGWQHRGSTPAAYHVLERA